MPYDDFTCDVCGFIHENHYKKTIMEDYPEILCPKCAKPMRKIIGVPATDVARGKHGNASDSYTTGVTYHPSKYGKYKGTKVKKI